MPSMTIFVNNDELIFGIYRVSSEGGGHKLFSFWVLPCEMFATKRTIVELHTFSNKVFESGLTGLPDDLGIVIVHSEIANEMVAISEGFGHIYFDRIGLRFFRAIEVGAV